MIKNPMLRAEYYAKPVHGHLGGYFQRVNDLNDIFDIRWGKIEFDVNFGEQLNIKVVLKVYREQCSCETYLIDTDAYAIQWDRHKRKTRDFFILPFSNHFGPISSVRFAYLVHLNEHSLASEFDYQFMDSQQVQNGLDQNHVITDERCAANSYCTYELNPVELQCDVDWYNQHFDDLKLTPKFTKGQQYHPFHPKRFIHDHIDKVIQNRKQNPQQLCTIKVSVDCIDDTDFINHLIHASQEQVLVQCIVDWRKMTLTNSDNYARLKCANVELIGVFCTPQHHLIEVEPDMHTKFIIFNDEDSILGSFNITFDRWWANWESGMTFQSKGVCRLLDNIFQSQRGGVNQRYGIDPLSPFNLLYTFGRQVMHNGQHYRPHHAILAEIHRAKHSIRLCLFLMGDLLGDYNDSVVDALIQAHHRGVYVHILFNGHLARQGQIGIERTMDDELNRALLPAVQRLRAAGIAVGLVYGLDDHPVPYSPIHSKYCVIDDCIVIEGSFNWYNTSVFSHDLLVVVNNVGVAEPYLFEFEQIRDSFRVYY